MDVLGYGCEEEAVHEMCGWVKGGTFAANRSESIMDAWECGRVTFLPLSLERILAVRLSAWLKSRNHL